MAEELFSLSVTNPQASKLTTMTAPVHLWKKNY